MSVRRIELPDDLMWRLYIRKPKGNRKTFRIVKKYLDPVTYETVKDKRIDTVNSQFKRGLFTPKQAHKELELVVDRLYHAAGARVMKNVANSRNVDILNDFWARRYKRKRLVDPDSMYNDFRRAVEAIGQLSLSTATGDEMYDEIVRSCQTSPKVHNRIVARLNTLFKFCRPNDIPHIDRVREPVAMVKHIDEHELEMVLAKIKERYLQTMVRMAFYSGCRQGELFALEPYHWKGGGQVQVLTQILRNGEEGSTKNRVERVTAFTGPEKVYDEWVKIKQWITPRQRHNASVDFKKVCREVFPDDKTKWLTFHDLRHCYAVSLALAGISIGHIARCLGNSEMVCEKYYTRFVQKSDTIDMIQRKFEEHRKRKP